MAAERRQGQGLAGGALRFSSRKEGGPHRCGLPRGARRQEGLGLQKSGRRKMHKRQRKHWGGPSAHEEGQVLASSVSSSEPWGGAGGEFRSLGVRPSDVASWIWGTPDTSKYPLPYLGAAQSTKITFPAAPRQ